MAGGAFDCYVICTSPRSGSTLLCDLLRSTGLAGNPDSWFHGTMLSAWLEDLGLAEEAFSSESEALAAAFRAAVEEGSLGGALFGLRLQRHSFDFFAGKLAELYPGEPGDRLRLEAAFGRTFFIHLTRLDKVEQAVSYVKAQQSGLWHAAPDGRELERLSPPRVPVYDEGEIRACFEEMTAYDRNWERWFQKEGIVPLRITYEALSQDPKQTLRLVLEGLGLDAEAANGVTPGVAKLADRTSRDWAERFRSGRTGG